MPISVTCPECNATYRVGDEAAGKAVKCKKCGARVPVPATGEGEPAEAAAGGDAAGGDEGERKRPAKAQGGSNKKVVIIIASIVAAFCCVCTGVGGGVAYYVITTGKAAAEKVLAEKGITIVKDKDFVVEGKKGVTASGPTILEKGDVLTSKDPAFNGKPAKTFKVKLEAGKEYIIDMKATRKGAIGHDPYLILLDPKGKELARDDDSGGGLDAQIAFTPPATDEYTIQATSLGPVPPDGLSFRLTVKQK
jgi:predicted Zn finger-like uncharacterized protein